MAIGISMNSMLFSAQSSISSVRIGREAPVMSVSPRQNFLKPPPVPERPTVTRVLPAAAIWNSSAMASEIGNTVDEPSIRTVGVSWAWAWPATATRASADALSRRCFMVSSLDDVRWKGDAGVPPLCEPLMSLV